MPSIKFSKEEKAQIVPQIQLYFREELDQDIGSFDAEFLLDFFVEQIGGFFYNRALYDVHAHLESKLEAMAESIYELEQNTGFSQRE